MLQGATISDNDRGGAACPFTGFRLCLSPLLLPCLLVGTRPLHTASVTVVHNSPSAVQSNPCATVQAEHPGCTAAFPICDFLKKPLAAPLSRGAAAVTPTVSSWQEKRSTKSDLKIKSTLHLDPCTARTLSTCRHDSTVCGMKKQKHHCETARSCVYTVSTNSQMHRHVYFFQDILGHLYFLVFVNDSAAVSSCLSSISPSSCLPPRPGSIPFAEKEN